MMKKRPNKGRELKDNIKAKASKMQKNKKAKNKSKTKRIILNILLFLVIFVIIISCIFMAYIIINAPKFDPNNLKFTQMSELYDGDGNLIAKMGNENRTEISYDDLPEVLIDAIIATEDSKFFQHNGFDLARFIKAAGYKVLGKNGGGASTLTMQIVKNNYTAGANGKIESKGIKGIIRKFTDIYMSIFKVERKYTKKEILEFYINDAYLGNRAYGV